MYILLVDRACWMGTSHHLSSSTNDQEGKPSASYEEIFWDFILSRCFLLSCDFFKYHFLKRSNSRIRQDIHDIFSSARQWGGNTSPQLYARHPSLSPWGATQELERHLEGIMFCCLPSTDKVFLNFLLFKTTVSVLRALFSISKEMTLSVCK